VTLSKPRWRFIIAAVVVVLTVAAFRLGNAGAPIFYYRVINDHTVVVGTVTGPWTWTRVTALTETPSSVTIGVNSLSAPLAGAGDNAVELTVVLRDPVDARTVMDANAGLPVQLAHCPPAYLAGSCPSSSPAPT
jgi:hypothetical protein